MMSYEVEVFSVKQIHKERPNFCKYVDQQEHDRVVALIKSEAVAMRDAFKIKYDALQKQLEDCRYAASELVRVDQLKQGKIAELQSQLAKAEEVLTQITLMLCMYTEGGSEDLGQAKDKARTYLAQRKEDK